MSRSDKDWGDDCQGKGSWRSVDEIRSVTAAELASFNRASVEKPKITKIDGETVFKVPVFYMEIPENGQKAGTFSHYVYVDVKNERVKTTANNKFKGRWVTFDELLAPP